MNLPPVMDLYRPSIMGVFPLAPQLQGFTVVESHPGNLLKWKVSSNEEVEHFEVERSKDGINFQNISLL